jgi:hypothetical protein
MILRQGGRPKNAARKETAGLMPDMLTVKGERKDTAKKSPKKEAARG